MKHSPAPGVSPLSRSLALAHARSSWSRRTILAGAIAAMCSSSALAITDIWDGSLGTNWDASGNWSTDPQTVPGAADFAYFTSSAAVVNNNTTIDLGTGVTIGSVS